MNIIRNFKTTYAVSALRHVLLNQPEQIPPIADMIVLSLIMLGFLWLSTSRMDWRQG